MKKIALNILALLVASTTFAYKNYTHTPGASGDDSRAAGCAPSNEKLFMEFNNVRGLIETAGSLWQDRANSNPSYEVPKNSNNHCLYAGALWMGGVDVNGQLKLAAHRFRQGNDFWAGPLGDLIPGTGNFSPFVEQPAELTLVKDNGAAEIIPSECTKYDRFYTIRKAEVQQFILWWKCENGELDPEDCADVEELDPEVLDRIVNWPAHGDPSLGQDFYLAPFYDNAPEGEAGNEVYDPITDGDYPWYDIDEEVDCRNDRRVTLFGDETHWWVFNDKGNIHTETGGDPIGMEIRAQAFSFATDDAINDMTFYNYELINRGTQTLFETYFGQYVDPDVGFAFDDFVGCDVGRGLGFCYNGDATDEGGNGQPGYGSNVPAIGVDFFEGPYQDNDGIDNPEGIGDGEALNGIGYGDGVTDNERFGMRRFVYYNNSGAQNGDPSAAADYYNYLKGIWKNGQPMLFGGNGFNAGTTTLETDFMFPGDSDPLNWGTHGVDPGLEWTEVSAGNPADDRRFVQSAGPFVLSPGALNNITVGVVYGRSTETDLEAPVRALKTADSKAQALFDNCFQLVEPPVAPILTVQEMENELILFLSDPPGERIADYWEVDKINIITPDGEEPYDDTFRFEGYQVYQMKDDVANVTQLDDIEQARIVAQCDVKNGVGRLVNYVFDEELNLSTPVVKVDGADEGISHSFRVTEDQFAVGDNKTLVNHKKYYYIAVAYGYNNFKTFDPTDPDALDGQQEPYLRSRISGTGRGIESVIGIPHDPSPEADGTVSLTSYGYQPEITQIEGQGNGGVFLELSEETRSQIMSSASGVVEHPTYASGSGPIDVKVIDPLNLAGGDYEIGFGDDSSDVNEDIWWMVRKVNGNVVDDTVFADETIGIVNEQLILDWGLSVTINQQFYEGAGPNTYTEPIGATFEFADSSKIWLAGIPDGDGFYPNNWIRSGSNNEAANHEDTPNPDCVASNWIYQPCAYDDYSLDAENSLYEQLNDGTIAPFTMVGKGEYGMPYGFPGENKTTPFYEENSSWFASGASIAQTQAGFDELRDVDIYITDNKELWTRCPVIEINDNESQTEHGDDILEIRQDLSVDKNGLDATMAGYNANEGDLTSGVGMGWFPGYAIDVNTGERMNMMFAENSWLLGENGADMIWNPTSSFADPIGTPLFGGMHYVYVFGNDVNGEGTPYDEGEWLMEMFDDPGPGSGATDFRNAWKTCLWVYEPFLIPNAEMFETDVKISARINKPYDERTVNGENNGFPLYRFSIDEPTMTQQGDYLSSVLDRINVVPNPYHGYSSYETSKLDNRVKITNVPERCTITIFNMQGALIRTYVKDDPLTSVDWDLKNYQGIPIAGGVYIIHIEMQIDDDGDGITETYEKILKWFGTLRQPDLDNL